MTVSHIAADLNDLVRLVRLVRVLWPVVLSAKRTKYGLLARIAWDRALFGLMANAELATVKTIIRIVGSVVVKVKDNG